MPDSLTTAFSSGFARSFISRCPCVLPDVIDDSIQLGSGGEYALEAELMQRCMVLLRQTAPDQPQLVGETAGLEQGFELVTEMHMRTSHAGKRDHIHVLLQRYARPRFRRLAQAGVNHLEACFHQRARHDLGTLVVAVQTRFGQEHFDRFHEVNSFATMSFSISLVPPPISRDRKSVV